MKWKTLKLHTELNKKGKEGQVTKTSDYDMNGLFHSHLKESPWSLLGLKFMNLI